MNLATLPIDSTQLPTKMESTSRETIEPVNTDILLLDRSQVNKDVIATEFSIKNIPISIQEVESALSLLDQLEEKKWHCVIIAIDQITISLAQLFKAIPDNNKNTPIIILTDHYERDLALKYIKDGAEEVITTDELEYLVYSIQRKIKETNLSTTIEAQDKLIADIHHNHHSLIDNLPLPYATIQEGIVLSSNQAFKDFFNIKKGHANEKFSFLDLVAKTDLNKIKKAFRKFNNNGKCKHSIHENISLKPLGNNTSPGVLYLLKTVIDNEMALQIIIHPQQILEPSEVTPPPATSNKLLTYNQFMQLLEQTICSKGVGTYCVLGLLEINNYDTLKKQIGIAHVEALMNDVSMLITNFSNKDIRIASMNSQIFSLLINADSAEECVQKLSTIHNAFNTTPICSDEQVFQLTCNIGAVHLTDKISSPSHALTLADTACATSRNNSQHEIHVYDPKVAAKNPLEGEELELLNQIKATLENDEFSLVYQPIIHIKDSPTPIYEVLLRMEDSEGVVILPTEFLPTAKTGGLCSDIDRWVIAQSMTLLRTHTQETLQLFVNISEASIQDQSFIAWLKTNDSDYLQHMVFEISENAVMNNPAEAINFTQACKQLGIEICLEHFGHNPDIGMKLEALAIQYCKIDGSFTSHLSTNRKNQMAVNRISRETKKLNIKTIACYVQDANSLAVLWQEGIDYIQGNYLQTPIPTANFQFNNF